MAKEINKSQPKVRVFTTPACPYCFTLKEYLKGQGIEFADIDVSKDKKSLEEIKEKTGRLEVPAIDIDGQMVAGFDKKRIEKLLNLEA